MKLSYGTRGGHSYGNNHSGRSFRKGGSKTRVKVSPSHMTEQELVKAYFVTKQIDLAQYQDGLRRIAETRHASDIEKTTDRSSMSSSKWR